jgi:hypothetical protein
MADIFSRTSKTPTGAYSMDAAKLTFTGSENLLLQNVQIQYQQAVTLVYDLTNPSSVYYVAGRSQGTLSVGKVVGKAQTMKEFYEKYGNVCKVTDNNQFTITGVSGCAATTGSTNGPETTITIAAPVCTSVGFSMTVDNALISEQSQFIFATMEIK